jgi:hypothetical protein
MSTKSKVARIAGFTVALGATASLVGFAATGTGAYFTDSHSGALSASTGDVKVNTSSLNLDFANLLPGTYKTDNIDYTATGTGPEDIWMVIPSNGDGAALGVPASGNSLGRFGHFEVHSNAGNFVSNNLTAPGASGPGDTGPSCGVDADGHGGNGDVATYVNQGDPSSALSALPFCPAPQEILLDSNLTNGQGGTASVTFGYTQVLRGGQDQADAQVAKFKIVATQHGIRPDDPNNPAGTLSSS